MTDPTTLVVLQCALPTAQTATTPACPICEARSQLHDCIAKQVKAAANLHHLTSHWRSAHEKREFSNYQAEDSTQENIEQFNLDTKEEERWFSLLQEANTAFEKANQDSIAARLEYLARLKSYTDTRTPKS